MEASLADDIVVTKIMGDQETESILLSAKVWKEVIKYKAGISTKELIPAHVYKGISGKGCDLNKEVTVDGGPKNKT